MSQDSEKEKKEKIVINLDQKKIQAVSDTYSLYASTDVEIGSDSKVKKVHLDEKHQDRKVASVETEKEEIKLMYPVDDVPKKQPVNKDLTSVKSLKPELQKPLRNIMNSIPKDQIKKLVNPNEEQKNRLFTKQGANSFTSLSEQDKALLIKKMDSWKVEEEIAEVNASASIAWVNNVGGPAPQKKKSNTGKLEDK